MDNLSKLICQSCLDEVDTTNQVLYKKTEESEWEHFGYCTICVFELKNYLWNGYINGLRTTDCQKTLKNLIIIGPPHNFRDVGLTKNEELYSFFYDGQIQTARLKGSLDREIIKSLHDELLLIVDAIDGKIMGTVSDFDYMARINEVLGKYSL